MIYFTIYLINNYVSKGVYLRLKNKKIYISPYTNSTKALLNDKILKDVIFLGFIDKVKEGENVYKISDIKEYDYILVFSPNHANAILKDLSAYRTLLVRQFDYNFYIGKVSFYEILKSKAKHFFYYRQYKIKSLINKHLGKRAFVIANGPSLKVEDIELIRDEITFAANKIWLLFDKTSWRPTYYTVADKLVMQQNIENIEKMEASCKLFPDDMIRLTDIKISNSIYFKKTSSNDFDLQKGIYSGPTVVYAMISYAIYMGIKELYIIGLDHNFSVPKKYENFKSGEDNVIISEGEVNHFHPDYRKKGEKWAQPELDVLEQSFIKIQDYAKQYGVKIYNASRFTKLDVFEKVNLDDLVTPSKTL